MLLGKFDVKLLYKGSTDGWEAVDFHYLCDSHSPTLSLFQIKDADCIGGYTESKWWSISDGSINNGNSMLFNIADKGCYDSL